MWVRCSGRLESKMLVRNLCWSPNMRMEQPGLRFTIVGLPKVFLIFLNISGMKLCWHRHWYAKSTTLSTWEVCLLQSLAFCAIAGTCSQPPRRHSGSATSQGPDRGPPQPSIFFIIHIPSLFLTHSCNLFRSPSMGPLQGSNRHLGLDLTSKVS